MTTAGPHDDNAMDEPKLELDTRSYQDRLRDAGVPAAISFDGLPLLAWDARSNAWTARDVLPSWGAFQSRGGAYGARDGREGVGTVRVSIDCDEYAPPHDSQIAAFRWLKAHEEKVAAVLLATALRAYPDNRAAWLEHYPDDASELPNIASPRELAAVMGLHDVHILASARDGFAYVGYEFGCNWDDEDGFGVLSHLDRVIEHGPARVAFRTSVAIASDGGVEIGAMTAVP